MTNDDNRRLDRIEITLDKHSDTLDQMALNVATIVEKVKHVPTWGQLEQAIERDATQRVELAISRCENRNHKNRMSDTSGSIKINLTNAKPFIKYLIYVLISFGILGGGYVAGDAASDAKGIQHETDGEGQTNE